MSHAQEHFADELERIIDRFRIEYDMTYAELVGTLIVAAHTMAQESLTGDEDDT